MAILHYEQKQLRKKMCVSVPHEQEANTAWNV